MKQKALQPDDVLLFCPTSFLGRLVSWATGSEYCHAAMFLGIDGIAEMREFTGGRIIPVTEYADETMDVFRADAAIPVRIDAVLNMRKLVKERYSFLHGIAAFLLRRIPKRLRKWFRFECDHHGYNCSQAISKVYRVAGFDLRSDLADWATTPGDLAKSKRLQNLGRLEF